MRVKLEIYQSDTLFYLQKFVKKSAMLSIAKHKIKYGKSEYAPYRLYKYCGWCDRA